MKAVKITLPKSGKKAAWILNDQDIQIATVVKSTDTEYNVHSYSNGTPSSDQSNADEFLRQYHLHIAAVAERVRLKKEAEIKAESDRIEALKSDILSFESAYELKEKFRLSSCETASLLASQNAKQEFYDLQTGIEEFFAEK